jgi:leucine-rich repeat/coiled-coil domain-containing protein 1
VARVKVLFESKEARLRSERDAARRQLEAAEAARDGLDAQVSEMRARLDAAVLDAERQRRAAAAATAAAAEAQAAAAAASEGAERAESRAAEVEREMAGLLSVVEAQKAASAAKMHQLASLLHEM